MVVFNKKKKSPILYEKYKMESIKKSNDIIKDMPVIEKQERVDKSIVQTKEKKIKQLYKEKSSCKLIQKKIIVTSFIHHVGCSYVANTLRNFLQEKERQVGMIYSETSDFMQLKNKEYIIYDVGTYSEISQKYERELLWSDIRIMICLSSNDFLEQLASFIKEVPEAKTWHYCFNYIPKQEYRKIEALMEDYKHSILPIINSEHLDKQTRKIFKTMIRG